MRLILILNISLLIENITKRVKQHSPYYNQYITSRSRYNQVGKKASPILLLYRLLTFITKSLGLGVLKLVNTMNVHPAK